MSGVSSTSEKHSEVVGQQEKVHSPLHKGHFLFSPFIFYNNSRSNGTWKERERKRGNTQWRRQTGIVMRMLAVSDFRLCVVNNTTTKKGS
jgi:hypothetical protein